MRRASYATLACTGNKWFPLTPSPRSRPRRLALAEENRGVRDPLAIFIPTVERRPDAPISVAFRDVRCLRCNGHGVPRATALSGWP